MKKLIIGFNLSKTTILLRKQQFELVVFYILITNDIGNITYFIL